MGMSETKDFIDTIQVRAERDPDSRVGRLRQAVDAMFSDDLKTDKEQLSDDMNATAST